MLWDPARYNWGETCERIRNRWIELNPQDIAHIRGSRARLIERLEMRYNMTREQAEKQVHEWEGKLPPFTQ